jgi:hypothetical protein
VARSHTYPTTADKFVGASELPLYIPGQPLLSSEHTFWRGFLVRRYSAPSGGASVPGLQEYWAVIHRSEASDIAVKVAGRWQKARAHPGDITIVVVNFKVTNPRVGQTITFSRSDVSIVASNGATYGAQGDNFVSSNSCCLGGTATFFIPSTEMSYSFVFVPHKATITQNYKLRFPNAEDVTFGATPK